MPDSEGAVEECLTTDAVPLEPAASEVVESFEVPVAIGLAEDRWPAEAEPVEFETCCEARPVSAPAIRQFISRRNRVAMALG